MLTKKHGSELEIIHNLTTQSAITCSKLTIETLELGVKCSKITKTPERRQWRRSDVFIVNFEHISHLVLVFLLLTLSKQMSTGYCPFATISPSIYYP